MSAQTDQGTRAETVRSIALVLIEERGPLLPILHAVQHEFGYIDAGDVPVIATVLNLSVAEVHGVVSFYKDFRTTPAPQHVVQVCRAEACQSVGGQALFDAAERTFGPREDIEVEEIFCFGNCALGPTVAINGRVYGRVTTKRLDALTREFS